MFGECLVHATLCQKSEQTLEHGESKLS